MSVRIKVLIVVILVAVITTAAVLTYNITQFSSFANERNDYELKAAIRKINETIKMMEAYSHSTAMFFAHDDELIGHVENRHRVLVTNRSMQLLRALERTGVEILTIINNEGVVISRPHTLASYGDDLSRNLSVRRALSGMETVGVDSLEDGNIAVFASVPIVNENELVIGVLIAGIQMDTDRFVDSLKYLTNCEVSVFKDDVRIATTLIDDNGKRAVGVLSEDRMRKVLDAGFDGLIPFEFGNETVLSRHIPIVDSEGSLIGLISVGRFLTDLNNTIRNFIVTGIAITLIILIVTTGIVIHITKVISAEADYSIKNVNIDSLTGVFNRRYFNNAMEQLFKTLPRSSNNWITLMMIDIDYFKKYNDTYGHLEGDECLKKVAKILNGAIGRENDFVARYGGEEFAVVLPFSNDTGAHIIGSLILENIRDEAIPHQSSDAAEHITISIGIVSEKVSHLHDPEDYILAADKALYMSKRNGRNQMTFGKIKTEDESIT